MTNNTSTSRRNADYTYGNLRKIMIRNQIDYVLINKRCSCFLRPKCVDYKDPCQTPTIKIKIRENQINADRLKSQDTREDRKARIKENINVRKGYGTYHN